MRGFLIFSSLMLLLSLHLKLDAALSDTDLVILNDDKRIVGNIIEDTPLLLVIKDRRGNLHKLPPGLIARKQYADGSDWGALSLDMQQHRYQWAVKVLEQDIREHPYGGSMRQIQAQVFCLRQTSQFLRLTDLCHSLCRREHEQKALLAILDLFMVSAAAGQWEEQERLWRQCIRISRYKVARQRCTAVLCCLLALRGEAVEANILWRKQDLDGAPDLQPLRQVIDAVLAKIKTDPQSAAAAWQQSPLRAVMPGLAAEITVRIKMDRDPDAVCLRSLRIALDKSVDCHRRLLFAEYALRAVSDRYQHDATIIKTIMQDLEQLIHKQQIKED